MAARPATATPAITPIKPTTINMPKTGGGNKVLGVLKNVTPQVTGEGVANSLETLEKVGLKDKIEEKMQKNDHETQAEIDEEEKRITRRILRINLFVSYLLFYTALMMQWLTLLGLSTSVGNFFYEFFINSFVFSGYDFSSLTTVGKIAGVTTSLHIIIFLLSNIFVIGINLRNKQKIPIEQTEEAIPNGGKFKFINNIKPVLQAHFLAVKKMASQFNQILGVLSQILIIIAASVVADDKLSAIDAYSNSDYLDPTLFPTVMGFRKRQEQGTAISAEENTLRVRHAALFAKTITIIAILAIIMTSFMNLVTWMADIWEVNRDELIIYKSFKFITRTMVCYRCFGDKLCGANGPIDDQTSEQENLALASQGNKKPQSAEKLLNNAQQSTLKNPNMSNLIKTTVNGPTQGDLEKISGDEKIKNEKDKEKKDLSTLAKDGVEKVLDGNDKGKKNAEVIDLAKKGIDAIKKISESSTSEGGKPNVEKLVTEGAQTAVTATEVDKNPAIDVVSQGIKTVTEATKEEEGKPDVEKLVTEGAQTVVTATGADKNPAVDVVAQGIKTVTEATKEEEGKPNVEKLVTEGVKATTEVVEGEKK